jgi:hypothetical protein
VREDESIELLYHIRWYSVENDEVSLNFYCCALSLFIISKSLFHSERSNRHRISLNLPATVNIARLHRHILVKRFSAVFLIRWFRDIRNKAVGHFKRKYVLLMVVVPAA